MKKGKQQPSSQKRQQQPSTPVSAAPPGNPKDSAKPSAKKSHPDPKGTFPVTSMDSALYEQGFQAAMRDRKEFLDFISAHSPGQGYQAGSTYVTHASVDPLAASVEAVLDKLYRYVYGSGTVPPPCEMWKVFGERARPILDFVETQRKEIAERPKDWAEPPHEKPPYLKFFEGVMAFFNDYSEAALLPMFSPTLKGPFREPTLLEPSGTEGTLMDSGLANVLEEFYQKLAQISMDTLAKVLEAVGKQSMPSATRKERQDCLMELMVRSGAEKFAILMENGSALDVFDTTHSGLVHLMCSQLVQTVNAIPLPSLPRVLRAMCLSPQCDSYDIMERVLVLGLQEVLRSVKKSVLKQIAQEVSDITCGCPIPAETGETQGSTGNHIHDIIIQVFPQEQRRIDTAKTGLGSSQSLSRIMLEFVAAKCEGHHGVTLWRLCGASLLRKCYDRLKSPEFEYGGLKWSLLCMLHKGNLAVYLRQTVAVRCVFFVYILNRKNQPEIRKEGTTTFTGIGRDKVLGFANVASFDTLFHPQGNIWNERTDIINFQVRIGILGADDVTPVPPPLPAPKQPQTEFEKEHYEEGYRRGQKDVADYYKQQAEIHARAAADYRKELEREEEKEKRRHQKKEQTKIIKKEMEALKQAATKQRKDIEVEWQARWLSLKDEADKDGQRVEKLKKQKEKIPKLMQRLQQENEALTRRHDEVTSSVRTERAAVEALRKEIATLTASKKKTDDEAAKIKAELDTVQGEIQEALDLIQSLKALPVPTPTPLAPPPSVGPPQGLLSASLGSIESSGIGSSAGTPGAAAKSPLFGVGPVSWKSWSPL